jgi:hypothetical protein
MSESWSFGDISNIVSTAQLLSVRGRGRPRHTSLPHESSILIVNRLRGGGPKVTAPTTFFCYTAINAFATVCSLSGDPDGSAPPPHFLPAWFQRQFQMRAAREVLKSLSSQFPVLSSQQNPDLVVFLRTKNWELETPKASPEKKTIE